MSTRKVDLEIERAAPRTTRDASVAEILDMCHLVSVRHEDGVSAGWIIQHDSLYIVLMQRIPWLGVGGVEECIAIHTIQDLRIIEGPCLREAGATARAP